MGYAKKLMKQKQNNIEIKDENEDFLLFLNAIEEFEEEEKVNEQKEFITNLRFDIELITEEEIDSLLDFTSKQNKTQRALKVKILNIISSDKRKNYLPILKLKLAIFERLPKINVKKEVFEYIKKEADTYIEGLRNDTTFEVKNPSIFIEERLNYIKRDLIPYFIESCNNRDSISEGRIGNINPIDEERAFKLLKLFYQVRNPKLIEMEGTEIYTINPFQKAPKNIKNKILKLSESF